MRSSRILPTFAVAAFAVAALVFSPASVDATAALKLDLPSLVGNSDRIVVGEVVSIDSFRRDGRIFTDTTLRVRETWKGRQAETVTIRQPGGRVGDITTRISGLARFRSGQESLVFLEATTEDKPFVVTGLAQGMFRVALGPDGTTEFAIPDVEGLQLLERIPSLSEQQAGSQHDTARSTDTKAAQLRSAGPSDLHHSVSRLETLRTRVQGLLQDREADR